MAIFTTLARVYIILCNTKVAWVSKIFGQQQNFHIYRISRYLESWGVKSTICVVATTMTAAKFCINVCSLYMFMRFVCRWMLLKSVWILIAMLSISDPTLTTDSVAEVMELVNDWDSLDSISYVKTVVPGSRLAEIQQRCSTKREIANERASYYVHCHPQPSWTNLATQLYREGEFAAVEKLKPFLPLRGKCQAISK